MIDPAWLAGVERRVGRWLARGVGPGWVVGVSGGSDSVGLLRVLHALAPRLGLRLTVAHLDHGVRGASARADAAFVAELAAAMGLPTEQGRWSPAREGHFEADARAARLAFLADVARRRGASAVVLGHTRDDQAETVLFRVVRGTGLRGLAGIPARRPLGPGLVLLRPLLDVSRDDLRAHLADLGQPYRDDATNADVRQARARIRHDLLPRIEAGFNPRAGEALARLAALAAASYADQMRQARRLARSAVRPGPDGSLTLDGPKLAAAPAVRRLEAVRLAWRCRGWPERDMTASRWRRLARLAISAVGPEGPVDIGSGVVAHRDGPRLVLHRTGPAPTRPDPPAAVPLTVPGSAAWEGGRLVVTVCSDDPRDETIDLDRLRPPLLVRAPGPGDRFDPLGMGGRTRPLNDFFRGRRVGRAERSRTPLLCDAEGIVWVVGHRIAERVRQTRTTVRTVGLRWASAPVSSG